MVGGSQRGGRFEMIRLEDFLSFTEDEIRGFIKTLKTGCHTLVKIFERKRIRLKLFLTDVIRPSH